MADVPYVPQRDGRFQYATCAIEHIESTSCVLGCRRAVPVDGTGPGGACDVLARIFVPEGPVSEISDQGSRLVCNAREPLDEVARAVHPDQEALL